MTNEEKNRLRASLEALPDIEFAVRVAELLAA